MFPALQERDPRAYQLYLQLPGGAVFLGSTPEQLYSRTQRAVASEAVAATRPRGPQGKHMRGACLQLVLSCPFPHANTTPRRLMLPVC